MYERVLVVIVDFEDGYIEGAGGAVGTCEGCKGVFAGG